MIDGELIRARTRRNKYRHCDELILRVNIECIETRNCSEIIYRINTSFGRIIRAGIGAEYDFLSIAIELGKYGHLCTIYSDDLDRQFLRNYLQESVGKILTYYLRSDFNL